AQREDLTGLRALRHFQLVHAVDDGNAQGVAERRAREADGHFAVEIVAAPLEDGVIFDVEDQIQVAGRSAALAGVAFPDQPQAHARVRARRNLDAALARFAGASAAVAGPARTGDHFAGSPTAGTGLCAGEGSQQRVLGEAKLTRAVTLRA